MAYIGETLDSCGTIGVNFSKVAVVAVSGVTANPCGHCILYVESKGGCYFHVDGLYDYPRYMTEHNYRRYLRENKKQEWKRIRLTLPNPAGAAARMEELLSGNWLWGLVPHNCVAFVEDLLKAGGATWSSMTNCPALATAEAVDHQVQILLGGLESSMYGAYRGPL